ncbi:hypothetical protein NLO83_20680 [Pseudomonas tremae]|uniref:hypothetical protein n=1 Tax=Pseudomonas syringae group TaxID=136849 RepID=UPI0001AF637D|nr:MULTISPECIES: hypothetical protein [Pseudomonas syringae group]MCQ3017999.1 hypothetical protein [Pseudomonas tremae]QGL58905.1 hypothetical protein POR16_22500 [Pseudomonas coronafaciens pv. oryzae str. 1_6]RMM35705.1 hypothetical protein ALQ80_00347 [Pseudomonas coronafaciens pv. oryzae]
MNRSTPLLRLSPQAAGDLHQQHNKAIAELRATARFNKELNNRLRSMIGPDVLRTLHKDIENALLLADLVEENDQTHALYVVSTKPEAPDESTCNQASEESGSDYSQTDLQAQAAFLRNSSWSTTQKTNCLCCTAAGITALPSSTTEAPVPPEKLREAATHDATLIAQNRLPAQHVVGGKALSQICNRPFQSDCPVEELYRFLNHHEPSLSDIGLRCTKCGLQASATVANEVKP